MNDFEALLPDKVEAKELKDIKSTSAWLESNVIKVRLTAGRIKYDIKDVVRDVFQAHELIVRSPVPGWSWRRYCREIGVAHVTPLRWFKKFGLKYTITHRPKFKKFKEEQKKYCRYVRYGVTPLEYEDMLWDQGNRCMICGKVFGPDNHSCVDHNHRTGEVRGLLCRKCNIAIGLLNEDPGVLKNAIRYLTNQNEDI